MQQMMSVVVANIGPECVPVGDVEDILLCDERVTDTSANRGGVVSD